MNKDITLKQLEYDIYQSEKKMIKRKSKQRTLEEHFKITYCKKDSN
jgi:hypothetical protein